MAESTAKVDVKNHQINNKNQILIQQYTAAMANVVARVLPSLSIAMACILSKLIDVSVKEITSWHMANCNYLIGHRHPPSEGIGVRLWCSPTAAILVVGAIVATKQARIATAGQVQHLVSSALPCILSSQTPNRSAFSLPS